MQTMTLGEQVTRPRASDSPGDEPRTMELVELMLKDRPRLDSLIRDDVHAPELIPRLLAVALIGYAVFGIAATLIVNLSHTQPFWMPSARWSDGAWASLTLAYVLGMVAATGVCLPSFYFYGLLAGVKLSMLQATAHAVKCLAVTAVVLVGALPIYVAIALGMIVFSAPAEATQWTIGMGLVLPFVAGLGGVYSLFVGFTGLADTLPACRRACFLRRLTLAWSVCYSTVTPVMIYWLWTRFAG
jgi:uncharacterized membrane protein